MESENYTEYFDAYIEFKLSNEERVVFEAKLKDDSEFKLQFDAHKAVVKHFREVDRDELKEKLKVFHEEMERKIRIRRIVTWTVSMAAILAGFIFLLWQPTQSSNQKIFELYAVVSPDTIFRNIITSYNGDMVRGNNLIRGDECIIENFTNDDCNKAEKALKYYNDKNYSLVVRELDSIKNLKKKNSILLLYLAISQLKAGDVDKAIGSFEYLSSIKGFSYKEQSEYYYGLALLKNGKLSEARAKFKSVKQYNGKYTVEAKKILKQMRWF